MSDHHSWDRDQNEDRNKQVILFDGTLLRATLSNPGQDRLFVSFRQRIGQPGTFSDPPLAKRFVTQGFSHLHVQSLWNDWFINEETNHLNRELSKFQMGFDYRCAMGFSMGGYGVLRFSKALRYDAFLAISPQYTIARKHARFDRRYLEEAKGFDADLGDLRRRRSDVYGAILVDPFKWQDLLHARMIERDFSGARLVALPCGGHPATRTLTERGAFNWVRDQLAEGLPDRGEIAVRHRNLRHKSPNYWKHLSQAAKKRGRITLATYADTQEARLLGKAKERRIRSTRA